MVLGCRFPEQWSDQCGHPWRKLPHADRQPAFPLRLPHHLHHRLANEPSELRLEGSRGEDRNLPCRGRPSCALEGVGRCGFQGSHGQCLLLGDEGRNCAFHRSYHPLAAAHAAPEPLQQVLLWLVGGHRLHLGSHGLLGHRRLPCRPVLPAPQGHVPRSLRVRNCSRQAAGDAAELSCSSWFRHEPRHGGSGYDDVCSSLPVVERSCPGLQHCWTLRCHERPRHAYSHIPSSLKCDHKTNNRVKCEFVKNLKKK
mmetsp:Transcript_18159/g.59626  ORF Transcript_18159/g.59626 Transcript_18159/m.59626 type:complete len:254 (-) Transcript_18159:577-1338(-)